MRKLGARCFAARHGSDVLSEQVAEVFSGQSSLFEGLGFFGGQPNGCFQSEQSVEDRAQRIDISALIRGVGLAARLLGCHVARCAHDAPRKGEEVVY